MGERGKVAFCFPGQGSQEVGMGRAFAESVPAARAVFDDADVAVGYDLTTLCFDGPIERLSETEVTQPALVAATIACLRGVEAAGLRADYVIGHSVGEYAALVASGAVSAPDAVRLVRERGLATAEAAAEHPGAMAALIGLADEDVEQLCDGIEGVWPANYNSPGQVVISGTADGVLAAMAAAEAAGARRAIRLRVSGGFHSPLTASAEPRLRAAAQEITVHEPATPFFSTVSTGLARASEIPELLVRQLTAPVRFTQSVEQLRDLGVGTFIEIGPGSVLSGLVRRIDRSLSAMSINDPEGLERVQHELADA
ncbi:MAG TPA: ACP S-malonyltransferase [Gaiellales bacterium]